MTEAAAANPAAGAVPAPGAAPAGNAAAVSPAGDGVAAGNGAAAASAEAKWYGPAGLEPAAQQLIEKNGFKSWNDVTKAYHDLQEKIGAKGVIVPGDKATPDERAAALRQFGAPEKPEGYALKYPDGYTPTETDKAYEGKLRAAAHKAGVPAWAFDQLAAAHMEVVAEVNQQAGDLLKAHQAKGSEEIATLEKSWGADATRNKALAITTAQSLIPKDSPLFDKLDSLLGAGPFVDLMYRVGTLINEGGGTLKAGGAGSFRQQSPEQAKADIEAYNAEIAANPNHAYRNQNDPLHKKAHEKMMGLMKIAYPGNVQD